MSGVNESVEVPLSLDSSAVESNVAVQENGNESVVESEAAKTETTQEESKDAVQYGDDEESKGKIENKANLATGNENEDLIYIHKAKLYRFRDGKWKERGNGNVKLLRNKKNNKIRFLLRTEKTKKVSANFFSKYCGILLLTKVYDLMTSLL